MNYHVFTADEYERYSTAILIKGSHFNRQELKKYYVDPMVKAGIPAESIIAFDLHYIGKKASTETKRKHLEKLLPELVELGITRILCADADYFKVLSRQTKADTAIGGKFPVMCLDEQFRHITVFPGVSYASLNYNPNLADKLDMANQVIIDDIQGNFSKVGENIIHFEDYPETLEQIEWTLNTLHEHPSLTCDAETFSLNVNHAGIGTIAFAWTQHEGIAFCVDLKETESGKGVREDNPKVRKLLREFFEKYKGNLKFHNATFDTKCFIRALWMRDASDQVGLLHGLHTMYRDLDDTKIITYLATNSTVGNQLGLKAQAQEFAGDWAEDDISDITRIPVSDLLRYNLVDCLSTWYVFNKHYANMLADKQEEIYKTLMLPSLKVITQMEITGLPVDPDSVEHASKELEASKQSSLHVISRHYAVLEAEKLIRERECEKANLKLKKLRKTVEDFEHLKFNPSSNQQLAVLLFEVLEFPIVDTTKSGAPATGASTLEKLVNHTTDDGVIALLNALISLGKAEKVLTSFIPNFAEAFPRDDGRSYVHGSLNLGGTISGRLSSNNPNLQNMPSGSKWGKLIKSCVSAPVGFLFCSADFNALTN